MISLPAEVLERSLRAAPSLFDKCRIHYLESLSGLFCWLEKLEKWQAERAVNDFRSVVVNTNEQLEKNRV